MNDKEFFASVAQTIEQARRYVGRTADLTMCLTYYEVGRMIVEREQGGKERSKYGSGLLAELSAFLKEYFGGKGYSVATLKNARQFYLVYSKSIRQTMFSELTDGENRQTLISVLENGKVAKSATRLFHLSWSHYLVLMRIKDDDERRFYEIEAENGQWSLSFLKRQYYSSLYERLALSRDKDEVMRLAYEGQNIKKPRDVLKDPLVLEFAGLSDNAAYSEGDLEQALINKMTQFLLELGKGFLYETRQKRFTFDEKHFFVDLVFYNRLLRCYVLIDLKIDELVHQDLGQMQMYVNYYDRYVKTDSENPTIGILLCKEKTDSIVELTLPADSNIYASEYSLYLPDKSLLQRKLAEWIKEYEENAGLNSINISEAD
jgi:predicted nuclease of restriction endonuclease-like (RecB) superfamily